MYPFNIPRLLYPILNRPAALLAEMKRKDHTFPPDEKRYGHMNAH